MATEGAPTRVIEAIVLAGGAGRRFGGDKLTSPWRGGPLIEGALAAAFAAPTRAVSVITGAEAGVAGAAQAFAERIGQSGRLRLIHAADHARGMAATLRAGMQSLAADTEAVFVFLGDMPAVPAAIPPDLARALVPPVLAVAPLFEGRRGHPVLFDQDLFAALAALEGDRGARGLLDSLGERLAVVECGDPGVLFDVDRPDPAQQARIKPEHRSA